MFTGGTFHPLVMNGCYQVMLIMIRMKRITLMDKMMIMYGLLAVNLLEMLQSSMNGGGNRITSLVIGKLLLVVSSY